MSIRTESRITAARRRYLVVDGRVVAVHPVELGLPAHDLGHRGPTVGSIDGSGEVELTLDRPDLVVPLRRQDRRGISDRDPSDRNDRARRELGVDLDDAPLIRTSAPAPSTLPGNSEAPVAMNVSLSTLLPLTCACGPIMTASPMCTGCPARPRTSACSITTVSEPMTTSPSSAVITAPCRMRTPGPRRTAPLTTADGAT